MIAPSDNIQKTLVPRESVQPSALAPRKPFEVRWTLGQRITRFLLKPIVWLQGRLFRRFLQLNAAGVAFYLSQLPMIHMVVATLIKLRIFDDLKSGPKSSQELAAAAHADEDTLLRILRTAAVLGILKRNSEGKFSLSPVGKQFLSDSKNPVAQWTQLMDEMVVGHLPVMSDAVAKGQNLLNFLYENKTCWEVMSELPNATELHDISCGRWSELVVDQVAKAYDFSQIHTVIDVGGGRGSFLSAMLKAAPHLQGRIYDRDTTRLAAHDMFVKHGVSARASHESGNFFESVPAGADLYTIKHVLHDWDDASAQKILTNIRQAVPSHGKLLIVEGSVEHDLLPAQSVRSIWDVTQYVCTWGKSRTLEEFSELAYRSGFHLANIYVPNTLDALILECVPIAGWKKPAELRSPEAVPSVN